MMYLFLKVVMLFFLRTVKLPEVVCSDKSICQKCALQNPAPDVTLPDAPCNYGTCYQHWPSKWLLYYVICGLEVTLILLFLKVKFSETFLLELFAHSFFLVVESIFHDQTMSQGFPHNLNASKWFNASMPFLLLPQPTSRSNSLRTAVPSVHICEPTSRDICVCLSQGQEWGLSLSPICMKYHLWNRGCVFCMGMYWV